jgi:dTMP kinase
VLLDSKTRSLAPMAELALMFAARAQHLAEVVLPSLEAGRWVLCDRFTDSSEAYQGGGRQMGSERILGMHKIVCGDLWPDMTVLMDSDPEASVARARRRNKANAVEGPDENRFEKEKVEFFRRVQAKYLEIAARETERVFVVDARKTRDVTHAAIVAAVRGRLRVAS